MTTNSPNPVDGDVQALIERAESAEAKLVELENQKLNAEVKLYRQEGIIPEGLNRCTAELVMDFSKALAEKLHRAEQKYGWSDGWKDIDWQEKCLADFNHHIAKGDPRDVAAYCAFMWFHGWQTRHTTPPAQLLRPVELPEEAPNAMVALCQQMYDHKSTGTTVAHDVWQDCLEELRLNATAQPVSDGWIRCTDSLPDAEGKYLVYETLNNRVNHDYWMEPEPAEGFWNHYDTSVTHWMPLPAAPGGQDDET